jgi:hypothetical protein
MDTIEGHDCRVVTHQECVHLSVVSIQPWVFLCPYCTLLGSHLVIDEAKDSRQIKLLKTSLSIYLHPRFKKLQFIPNPKQRAAFLVQAQKLAASFCLVFSSFSLMNYVSLILSKSNLPMNQALWFMMGLFGPLVIESVSMNDGSSEEIQRYHSKSSIPFY